MSNDTNILITFIVATVVLGLFVIFFVFFFLAFQRRQIQNIQEKVILQAQFEQEMLTSQNEIQEETMRHISRELHDNVVQMLTLVKIQLNRLPRDLPDYQTIVQSKEYLTEAIADLRSLSKTLNTDNILHEGLAKSIEFELKRIEKASTLHIEWHEQGEIYRLNAKQEIMVFRIFQELIQNVLKHANAKNIKVLLEENDSFFKIDVEDDGVGFDFDGTLKKRGFESGGGLANMAYRASLLHGTFGIQRGNSGGSLSRLVIPITSPL